MEVIQVRNPAAFSIPAVQDLALRALSITQRVEPENIGFIAQDIYNMVFDPNAFIFLGAENGIFKLITLGFLPTMRLMPRPVLLSFYNEGSRALRDLGKKKLLDFLKEHGYNTAWAVNGTKRSDAAWKRVFGQEGVEISPIGTVFELKAL